MHVYRTIEEAELALMRKVTTIRDSLSIVAKLNTSPEVVASFEDSIGEWLDEFFEARRMVPLGRRSYPVEIVATTVSPPAEVGVGRLRWDWQRAWQRVEARQLLAAHAAEELADARAVLVVAAERLSEVEECS